MIYDGQCPHTPLCPPIKASSQDAPGRLSLPTPPAPARDFRSSSEHLCKPHCGSRTQALHMASSLSLFRPEGPGLVLQPGAPGYKYELPSICTSYGKSTSIGSSFLPCHRASQATSTLVCMCVLIPKQARHRTCMLSGQLGPTAAIPRTHETRRTPYA